MSNDNSGGTEGPIFVSAKVAAERLGLKSWDVYELVRKGELAHLPRKSNREKVRVYAADLARWAAENAERRVEKSA